MNRLILLLLVGLGGCSTDPLENNRELMRPDLSEADEGPQAGADAETDADNGGSDMGAGQDDVALPDMADGLCRPNRDGIIERSEVSLQAGLTAKFAVASDVRWDTTGEDVDGVLTWDLSQDFTGDATTLVELRDLAGHWFEPTFPDADYFTPLGAGSDLLGVFRVTDDEVLLLGVVSPEAGIFQTELEYDPAVPVLQFPLQAGDAWSVETDVSGTYEGVITVYTETYRFEADQLGTMVTPYGTFPSTRVRSLLERQVGLLTTVIRSFAFVTECFGTVASVASQDGESGAEFTDISELRRITP